MIFPMLAKPVERLPSGNDYVYEIKLDGQRTIAEIKSGKLLCYTRNQQIVTDKYPELHHLPSRLNAKHITVDGEIIALKDGVPSFELLQQRMSLRDLRMLKTVMNSVPVLYYLFDVLEIDGKSVMDRPLMERKKLLQKQLRPDEVIKLLPHFESKEDTVEKAEHYGYEGVVAKKRQSCYYPGQRSDCWLKYKFQVTDSFVICGWLEGGRSENFGSLIVGKYEGKQLKSCGRVGTGFNDATIRMLMKEFERLASAKAPFPSAEKKAHWLKPQLVADVKFKQWTNARILRAPVYLGLRRDLRPKDCAFS